MPPHDDPGTPLRIAFVTQAFAKGFGYIENAMPRHFARQGHEVQLITLDLSPYLAKGPQPRGAVVRQSELPPGLVEKYDGYTLNVLGHRDVLGYPRPQGLLEKLRAFRPHIVQTGTAIGWIPLQAAVASPFIGYKLFTGSHTNASQFPLADPNVKHPFGTRAKAFATRWIPGRFVSLFTQRCWTQTNDSRLIASRFFGVQKRKVETMHLGVETDQFHPARTPEEIAERERTRHELGVAPTDIMAIYTGKLSSVKNVRVLADAVTEIRKSRGLPYKAVFIGEGDQRQSIEAYDACRVLSAIPHAELARYYRAADIGVWPTSESVSTHDAAACGLPLICGDLMTDREHVDGNGLVVKSYDVPDLVRALLELGDPATRARLGANGAEKMLAHFSWAAMASRRLVAYRAALAS